MPSPTYKHETGTVKDGGLTTNNKPLGPINCSGTNQEQVFNKPLGPINPLVNQEQALDSGVASASLSIMCKNGGLKPFYSANPTSFSTQLIQCALCRTYGLCT